MLILFGIAAPALAQGSRPQADSAALESLTLRLVDLGQQIQARDAANNSDLLTELETVALARQQALAGLASSNPSAVLRVSLPADIRANLPASVQNLVEQETDVTGQLEVQIEDRKDGSTLHHFLNTGSQRLTLHFSGETPTNLLTGSAVRLHGLRWGNSVTSHSITVTDLSLTSSL